MPMAEHEITITDRLGYILTVQCYFGAVAFNICVLNNGQRIAYLRGACDDRRLLLGDLLVDEGNSPEFSRRRSLFSWHRYRSKNWRGRGIGPALIEIALEEARSRGLQTAEGNVATRDSDAFPGLRDFYEKLGFKITDPLPSAFSGTAFSIVKRLHSETAKIRSMNTL